MNSFTFCLLLFILTAPSTVQAGTKCQSRECISLSAQILSWMNKSADPCENFYEYACGNFKRIIKYNPSNAFSSPDRLSPYLEESTFGLMEDKSNRRTFEVLVRKGLATDKNPRIRELYSMTEQFFESCTQWMRINDKSANFESYAESSSAHFIYGVSAHLVKTFNSHGLLVKANKTNTDNIAERIFAALIGSGADSFLKMTLPDDFAYEAFVNNQNLTGLSRADISVTVPYKHINYNYSIGPIMTFFNQNAATAPWPYEFTDDQLKSEVIKLNKALNVESWVLNCSGSSSIKTEFTVSELEQLSKCASPIASFSWMKLFEYLLHAKIDNRAKVNVQEPTVVINFANYFNKHLASVDMTSLFKNTKVRLLVYDWLLGFSSFLPYKLREIVRDNKFEKFYFELQVSKKPVESCIYQAKTYLTPLVSRMYHNVYLSHTAFEKVNNLIRTIVDASIELIKKQKWITNYGKEVLVEKMKSLKHYIGFEEVTDVELLKFYSESLKEFRTLNTTNSSKFFNYGRLFALSLMSYSRKNFDLLSAKTTVSVFASTHPMEVNAFFYPNYKLVFPMAILTPPVFHETFPNYVNLAGLGSIVGHEIGHAIDLVSRLYSVENEGKKILDNATHENYMNITRCIKNQFASQYEDATLGAIYANKTLADDIADILSSGPSFYALRSPSVESSESDSELPNLSDLGATQQQLYFILNAQQWCQKSESERLKQRQEPDEHSENPLRVNGIAINSDEFSRAFLCEVGAPMNPINKCKFW